MKQIVRSGLQELQLNALTAAEYLRWMHYGREVMSKPMRKDVIRWVDLSDYEE